MQISGELTVRRGAPGGRRFGLQMVALLIVLFCGWAVPIGAPVAAQQFSATVSVTPADISVAAGDPFEVTIVVEGARDLGGFQLSLRYDPALVQVDKVTLGEFIGSTGRDDVLLGPSVDLAAGQMTVGAFTAGTAEGAVGKGVLVTVACTALRAGQGALGLAEVVLSDTKAAILPATTTDGKISFTGDVVVPTATPPATPTTAPVTPAATAAPATAEATPGQAVTVEPIETLMVVAATQTAQAWRTAEAQWTLTPIATMTPEPAATAAPGETPIPALTPTAEISAPAGEPTATPAPQAPPAGSGAGLGIGLGVGAAALGVGGIYLWRRGRQRGS